MQLFNYTTNDIFLPKSKINAKVRYNRTTSRDELYVVVDNFNRYLENVMLIK